MSQKENIDDIMSASFLTAATCAMYKRRAGAAKVLMRNVKLLSLG